MRKVAGLAYELRGDGEPLLLIHGSHLADAFLPLARESALADRYRILRYYRRGFAGSDPLTGPWSIAAQARDAAALLQELGIERAHVAGFSYGAVTATQLAHEAPHAVGSLILLEPPLVSDALAAPLGEMFAPLLEQYRSGDVLGAVDAFVRIVGGVGWRDELARVLPGSVAQIERDAATFFEVEVPALFAWRFDSALAKSISQPALYLLGSESGPLFEQPMQLFRSLVPQTELHTVPGVNHLEMVCRPHLLTGAIVDFLARHPLDPG